MGLRLNAPSTAQSCREAFSHPSLSLWRSVMSKTAKLALLLAAAILPAAWGAPAQAQCNTSPTVVTLFAGRTMNAGTITVNNDASNLYVQYATTSPWLLTEAHLAVADSLAGIPQTKKGNPV